jgi:hypothetical protein
LIATVPCWFGINRDVQKFVDPGHPPQRSFQARRWWRNPQWGRS